MGSLLKIVCFTSFNIAFHFGHGSSFSFPAYLAFSEINKHKLDKQFHENVIYLLSFRKQKYLLPETDMLRPSTVPGVSASKLA